MKEAPARAPGLQDPVFLHLLPPGALAGSQAGSKHPQPQALAKGGALRAPYRRRRGLKKRGREGRSSPLAAGGHRRPAAAVPGRGCGHSRTVLRACECPRGPGPRGPRASYGSLPRAAVYVRFLSLCAQRQEDYENDSLSELQHQIAQPRDEMHHSTTGRLGGLLQYPGAVARGSLQGVRCSQGAGVSEWALRVGIGLVGNPSQQRSPARMSDFLQSSR